MRKIDFTLTPKNAVPFLGRGLHSRRAADDAGVVEDNIHAAEFVHGGGEDALDVSFVRHVGGDRHCRAAGGVDLIGDEPTDGTAVLALSPRGANCRATIRVLFCIARAAARRP
jgi:hypothetical protein